MQGKPPPPGFSSFCGSTLLSQISIPLSTMAPCQLSRYSSLSSPSDIGLTAQEARQQRLPQALPCALRPKWIPSPPSCGHLSTPSHSEAHCPLHARPSLPSSTSMMSPRSAHILPPPLSQLCSPQPSPVPGRQDSSRAGHPSLHVPQSLALYLKHPSSPDVCGQDAWSRQHPYGNCSIIGRATGDKPLR